MEKLVIPIGTRVGYLTVIRNDMRVPGGDGIDRPGVLCKCLCGGEKILKNGMFWRQKGYCGNSCGFRWAANLRGIGIDSSKGYDGWPGWYKSYQAMRGRCLNENSRSYKSYGGKGVRICSDWLKDPLNFFRDMGDRPPGMTLDRIDPNGNYTPDNCRWATDDVQAQNKRNSEQHSNLASD